MKSAVTVYSILLSALSFALGAPARRIGDAGVREAANGVPSLTVSEREERRGGKPNFDDGLTNGRLPP